MTLAGGVPARLRTRASVALASAVLLTAVAAIFLRGGAARTPSRAAIQSAVGLLDWGAQAKLPPHLSPIQEGSKKAVAIVLGQAMKPDGKPSMLLIDRAKRAKQLLDSGTVEKLIVSGGDPAGVGHTEASAIAEVLRDLGVSKDSIIQEAQATTTAENAWFAMRWIPQGTGQFYIVTSDFHMPRARWIIEATFNHFYKTMEELYKDDANWKSEKKRYPRLKVHEAVSESFCGNASKNSDNDPEADISEYSLAKRTVDELKFMGSGEAEGMMRGPPFGDKMFIWPVPVDVARDPDNDRNMEAALARIMNMVGPLCACSAPPEREGGEICYPLQQPVSARFPKGRTAKDWEDVAKSCPVG